MLNHSSYHNSIGGGNFDHTELTLSTLASIKRRLSLCIGAMAAVFLCVLSVACSPDEGTENQVKKELKQPKDTTTHTGGSSFEFDTEDEDPIEIDLNS